MDDAELLAKTIFEAVTRRSLEEWDVPPRQGVVDFRVQGSPSVSLEVKRLTAQDFHAAHARLERVSGFVPSTDLTRHWHVMLDVPTSGSPVPLVDVRRLPERLIVVLRQLECRAIFNTRGASPDFDPVERRWFGPLLEFAKLTHGALGLGHEASERMPAGLTIVGGGGHTCRDEPDVLADLVGAFLVGDSKEAINLRTKLGRSHDAERHAFVVLTGAIDEAWLFDRWGEEGRVPLHHLTLPDEIDRVWISRGGPAVWTFSRSVGWASHEWREGVRPSIG